MSSIFKLILSMSLSGSIMILALLLLKPLFREKFSKAWQYYIWIIVLIRLVLPYSPEFGLLNELYHLRTVNENAVQQPPTVISNGNTSVTIYHNTPQVEGSTDLPAVSEIKPYVKIPNSWDVVAFLWLAGVLMLFALKMLQYLHFKFIVRRKADPVADHKIITIYQSTSEELGIKKRPQLYYSKAVTSPMLIGLFKPTVYLTQSVLQLEEESLAFILRHELMHYKRHDLWYKWCCDITLCIHWFNPFVHIMSRVINTQCEISCDEAVARDLNAEEKLRYGTMLLDAAADNIKYQRRILSTTLYEDKKSLAERITSIMKAGRKSKRTAILSLILAVILCAAAYLLGVFTANENNKNNISVSAASDNESQAGNKDTESGDLAQEGDTASASSDISNNNEAVVSNESEASDNNEAVVSDTTDTSDNNEAEVSNAPEDSVIYSNTEYGFDFNLPESWKGYTIQSEDWQGTALSGDNQGEVVEAGTKIMIRHPEWTKENPRQDIPVMVFTLDQWKEVEEEMMAVSAAPIGPSELGRNSKYVFALPARYNFAFLTGFEEVEDILEGNALVPNENFK